MPDPIVTPTLAAAAGTHAFSVLMSVVGNRADFGAVQLYKQLHERFYTLNADENHELQRAALRSFWLGLLYAAAEYGELIDVPLTYVEAMPAPARRIVAEWRKPRRSRIETLASIDKEARQAAVRELFQQLRGRVDGVRKEDLATQQQVDGALQQVEHLLEGDGGALRAELTRRALTELRALQPDAPAELLDLIEKHWFELFAGAFQWHVRNRDDVEKILNAKMLARLLQRDGGAVDLGRFEDLLENHLEALADRIISELHGVEVRLGDRIDALQPHIRRPSGPLIGVVPVFSEKVYGRDAEIEELISLLRDPDRPHVTALVAPPGYGKSALLRGALQQVTDYGQKQKLDDLDGILCFDCRAGLTLEKIIEDVSSLSDDATLKALPADKQIEGLLAHFGRLQAVWLIFQNTEELLDAEARFRDEALDALVSRLNERHTPARLLIESRFRPALRSGKPIVTAGLGERLLGGLAPDNAVAWVRDVGQDVGLDQEPEDQIRQLIARLHGVPLWIESAIIFMRGRALHPVYRLADFLGNEDLLSDFDSEDREVRERGFQRLVAAHVGLLSDEAKQLLGFVAFFGFPVPLEMLEALLSRVELGLPLRQLTAHRLLRPTPPSNDRVSRYELAAGLQTVLRGLALWSPTKDLADGLHRQGREAYESGGLAVSLDIWSGNQVICQALIEAGGDHFRPDLARAEMNRAIALASLGRASEALPGYDRSIKAYEALIEAGGDHLRPDLARAEMNRANAIQSLSRESEALPGYDRSIEAYEALIKAGGDHLRPNLAHAEMNRATALDSLGRASEALPGYDRSIEIYEALIGAGGDHFRLNLALAEMNRAIALDSLGRASEALPRYDCSIKAYEALIEAGDAHLSPNLAHAEMNRAIALASLGRASEALPGYDRSIKAYEALIEAGDAHLRPNLALAEMNRAIALKGLGRASEALPGYDRSIEVYEALIGAGGDHLRPNLALAEMNRSFCRRGLWRFRRAVRDRNRALAFWEAAVRDGNTRFQPRVDKLQRWPWRLLALLFR